MDLFRRPTGDDPLAGLDGIGKKVAFGDGGNQLWRVISSSQPDSDLGALVLDVDDRRRDRGR